VPARTSLPTSSKQHASNTDWRPPLRLVIPTAQTSPLPCCCFGRKRLRAGSSCVRWCRWDLPGADAGLQGNAVLIASGARDPIAPPANAARLKAMLEQAGAQVDHRILPGGHELSQDDVDLARAWLQAQEAALPAAS
jgi:hypothetical protein